MFLSQSYLKIRNLYPFVRILDPCIHFVYVGLYFCHSFLKSL